MKTRRNGDAVSAVAIKQRRRRAVEWGVATIDEADRHKLAICCLCLNAPRHIVIGIMTRGHVLGLQQRALARCHVVIVELARGGHRGIGEADCIGVVFLRTLKSERIGFLVKGDGVFLAGFPVADDDARQAGEPLKPDQVSGKGRMRQDQPPFLMRHHFLPVFLAGG